MPEMSKYASEALKFTYMVYVLKTPKNLVIQYYFPVPLCAFSGLLQQVF